MGAGQLKDGTEEVCSSERAKRRWNEDRVNSG